MPKTIKKIEAQAAAITKRLRVAAYARVSLETERLENSLSQQISRYSALIQQNPAWEYAGVYADNGISGTGTEKRTEFQRMLQDCREGRIQLILTKSVSRFARNTVDLLKTVRELKEIGVEVWFEKENIHSLDGKGELMLTILASFAQAESHSISENCKWGIRKQFKKGHVRPGKILGYRSVNDQYVIEPQEAETVKRAFQLYLSGLSFYKVALQLNKEGCKSYTGKPLCGEVVAQILRNEKYTGNSLLQKYHVKENHYYHTIRNKGELPMYYAEQTHPAIISQETFDAVQHEIAKRYGVGVENGIAQRASYFYHHGPEITKTDYRFRRAQWSEEDRKRHAELYKSRATMKYLHYDLSIFIKCEGCGENLTAKKRKYADGTPVLYWECHKHNKRIAEMGIHQDIPRPACMKDEKLKELIAEVLDLEAFDIGIMTERLSYISSAGNRLTFHFRDGHTEEKQYIAGKRRYVRRQSACLDE